MHYNPPPQPKKPYHLKLPKQYQADQSSAQKSQETNYYFIRCWWLWPVIAALCLIIAYMALMDKFFDVPSEDSIRLFYPIFFPALRTYGLYMMLSLPCVLMTFRLSHGKNIHLQ